MNWRISGGSVGFRGRSAAPMSVNRLIMPSWRKRLTRSYNELRGTPVSNAPSTVI
jgi:hypothetical protein